MSRGEAGHSDAAARANLIAQSLGCCHREQASAGWRRRYPRNRQVPRPAIVAIAQHAAWLLGSTPEPADMARLTIPSAENRQTLTRVSLDMRRTPSYSARRLLTLSDSPRGRTDRLRRTDSRKAALFTEVSPSRTRFRSGSCSSQLTPHVHVG